MNPDLNYSTVFEDSDIVVVHKPPGLLSVPGLSEPRNLFDDVKADFPTARTVHRLDMATSGLIIFALNHETQKSLGQQFEKRSIKKRYSAIVAGIIKEQSGEIHSPLICDWEQRPKQKIDWISGKPASTLYQVVSRDYDKDQSRLLLFPHTGRTHQLRLHMLQLNHPILGDNLYHQENSNARAERLLLHAEYLAFRHPRTLELTQLNCDAAF